MTAETIKVLSVTQEAVPVRIPAVQSDTGRTLVFALPDLDIPDGATAQIYIQKPSGAIIYNACTIGDDGGTSTVSVKLTSACLDEQGDAAAQVRVVSGADIVTTFVFVLVVREKIVDDGAIEGTDEFTALEEALQTVQSTVATANEAKATAEAAKATAEAAKSTAETAKSTAETAQTTANAAMPVATYDPAGGAKQVAFADELATVSASASAAQSAAEAAQSAADAAQTTADGKLPLAGGTLTGSLTVEGHANPIGAYYEKAISATVANDTSVNVQTMNCSAGRWLITGHFQFANATGTGYRAITLSTSSGSLDSGGTDMRGAVTNAGMYVSTARVFNLTSTTTIYCTARQTSGSSTTVGGQMVAVRIA